MPHLRGLVPHLPSRERPAPSEELTVTLTARERRLIARSLEFVEEFVPAASSDAHREMRERLMQGLEQ